MKTKEDFKKEYKNHKIENKLLKEINSKEDLEVIFELEKYEIADCKNVCNKEKKANYIQSLLSRIENVFSFFTGYYNQCEIYGEDNEILDEYIKTLKTQETFFDLLGSSITEENYKEIAKLGDYSVKCFNYIIDYYDDIRQCLEYSYQGISYMGIKEDTRDAYTEFMTLELQSIVNTKNLEKVKKI